MEKKLRNMEIEPAENGGHTVTHRYREIPSHSSKNGLSMGYTEPESHVFGPEDGHKMLAHVANHLHITELGASGKAMDEAEDTSKALKVRERDV